MEKQVSDSRKAHSPYSISLYRSSLVTLKNDPTP